ncbi:hypothetical protein EVJ32_11595 [Exiguobacterium sp. SH5S4]|uniref:lipopolysaccharide biosynthesis protein n=1 Tax=Exiguobacterium sp. SH5S4 TaxID=2510961 RepID=UPI001040694C|nr:polysaccharide biosynthesis C-terminal domain-containing protein [Exiguobacterium sp. SH5S4]TCI25138.1 hypothetical protein EVJ32_11595 [Exiguobacterium sp. SH5S4]
MKEFIFDFVKYIPSKLLPGLVGIIAIPVITRLFSPNDYGVYSIIITTINIMLIVGNWQLMSIVRYYPHYEVEKKVNKFNENIMFSLWFTIISISFLFMSMIILLNQIISEQYQFTVWLAFFVVILTIVFNTLQTYFRVVRKVNYYSYFESWKGVTTLTFGILFVLLISENINNMLIGYIISLLIILPFMYFKLKGTVKLWKISFSKDIFKKISDYGVPLVIVNLSAWILNLSDRYILSIYRGVEEVGIYTANYDIADKVMMLIVGIFIMASGPIVNRIWEHENEEKAKEFLEKVAGYYIIVCLPAVIGLSILSKVIAETFLGAGYSQGYIIIPFAALGAFLLGLQQRYHASFQFFGKNYMIAKLVGFSGGVNIILNILLIPTYGYLAAGVTTLISYLVLLILIIFFSREFFKWKFPTSEFIQSACSSLVMSVPVLYFAYYVEIPVFFRISLSVIFGIVTYILVILILRILEKVNR